MRDAFSSLRARVLVLIAIPFAVVLGMTFYHALGEREDRVTNASTRVLDTARVMAGEQQRIIEHVHQVLASEALLPEVRRSVAVGGCTIGRITGRLGIGFAYPALDEAGVPRTVVATTLSLGLSRPA